MKKIVLAFIFIFVVSATTFAQQKSDHIDPATNSTTYDQDDYYFSKNFVNHYRHQIDKWGNAQLEEDFLTGGQWRVVNMNDEARIAYSQKVKLPDSFLMELRLEQIQGEERSSYGIFIGDLSEEQLAFIISANGGYTIGILSPFNLFDPVTNLCSGFSEEINKGSDVMNTLGILKENGQLSFILNNKTICNSNKFEIDNEPKQFYLAVNYSTVDFDYFRIADNNPVLNRNYSMSFNNLKDIPTEWKAEDMNSFDSHIANDGSFRLTKKQGGRGEFKGPELDLNKDFKLKVDFKEIDISNFTGIYLRSKDYPSNYLQFLLFKNNFTISREGNKERSTTGISQAINQSDDDYNELQIIKSGLNYSFFINGELVNEFELLSLQGIYNLGIRFSHKGTISLSEVDFEIIQ